MEQCGDGVWWIWQEEAVWNGVNGNRVLVWSGHTPFGIRCVVEGRMP